MRQNSTGTTLCAGAPVETFAWGNLRFIIPLSQESQVGPSLQPILYIQCDRHKGENTVVVFLPSLFNTHTTPCQLFLCLKPSSFLMPISSDNLMLLILSAPVRHGRLSRGVSLRSAALGKS